MLNKYLKSIEWISKNESKMTPKIWNDFHEFLSQFDAWVATQDRCSRDAIESTIKAVRMVLAVFPKATILQSQGG